MNNKNKNESSKKKEICLASEEMCTGCAACAAVCPAHAISMEQNAVNGFFYPHLHLEKCIYCGQCENICPVNHTYRKNMAYSSVYAADNKDAGVRGQSASGGLFAALAREVLKSGGSVAGVAYTPDHACEHKIAENESELECLKGTKYFQSDMSGIYGEIDRQAEEKGRRVLFCGTPCQVRAVKNFAQKKGLEGNLFLVDLLCRGIPSPYVYKKYIEFLEQKHGKKVADVHFKEKTRGWDQIGTMITFQDGTEEYEGVTESLFLQSFIHTDLSVRDACFSCPYKTIHRESDITIGDFWGLRNTHLMDNKGTSLVIVHTEKGKALFERTKESLDFLPSTMWRVYKGNPAAFHDVVCGRAKRKYFFELLHDGKDLKEALEIVIKRGEGERCIQNI